MGPQLERFLDLSLKRDPQAATTYTRPSFLDDPRLPLGDELPNGLIRGSNIVSLSTSHHYQWMIVLVLQVAHWGVKHALPLLSTTMASATLGVGYRLFQKAMRMHLLCQMLPYRKGLKWARRQLKYQGCRLLDQAERVGASHGSQTVMIMSAFWHFRK